MKHRIELKSWDGFQLPFPFTEAVILQGEPIWAPPDSSEDDLRALHGKMQETLDALRIRGDKWWSEPHPETSGKS
jgi:lysophospholipid acyltransferase (LPLAT)-like uncharacterized protein